MSLSTVTIQKALKKKLSFLSVKCPSSFTVICVTQSNNLKVFVLLSDKYVSMFKHLLKVKISVYVKV